jgi:hypothetical protein
MPKHPLVKVNWLDRAAQVHNYHVSQCKDESNWTIERTARELNRSVGSVAQDLLIASWIKTHEKQLKRFRSMKDALEWVRDKKREMKMGEID